MKVGYAYTPENEGFVAKATGREMRVKSKDCREICAAIQGMKAQKAEAFLQRVLDRKDYIPIKKTKLQSGHKKGMKPYGAQPVKAVDAVLGVLKAAMANAEFRGLDVENCTVVSALTQRGHKVRRMRPKGRHAVYETHLSTVQIFLEEASE
jgi:large subunit ribosomal protein L22